MYLVTFRLAPGEYDAEFHALNDSIQALAEDTAGYLGKRTWHDPESDEVLVVYFWGTLDALESFGAESLHERANQRWADWYEAYEVTVAEVLDVYGNGFDGDAGLPRAA